MRFLFAKFNIWQAQNCATCSQKMLSVAKLSMKGINDWPEFKCKAANCTYVCKFLHSELQGLSHASEEFKLLKVCVESNARLQAIMARNDRKLSRRDARLLFKCARMYVVSWDALSRAAFSAKRARYRFNPKWHLFEEGMRRSAAKQVTPRSHYVYRHGSFIGTASKLAARTHAATASVRALQRWCLKLRVQRRTLPPPKQSTKRIRISRS